jgi:Zn-dependent protease
MLASLRLGRIFNIETTIHWSFWLLLLWVLLGTGLDAGWQSGLAAAGFLTTVFVCVYLHELGHAFAASQCGIRTVDITMLPIGGMARLERLPDNPRQELWIAIAGPLVNIVIAFLLGLFLFSTSELGKISEGWSIKQSFLEQLLVVNVFLAVFNMIPALPMDGGRIFRALLEFRYSRLPATEIAAKVGRFIAVLFIAVGLFKSFNLVLIGLFVMMAGYQELMMVRFQAWRAASEANGGSASGSMPGGGVWFSRFESNDATQGYDYRSESGKSGRSEVLDAEDVRRIE